MAVAVVVRPFKLLYRIHLYLPYCLDSEYRVRSSVAGVTQQDRVCTLHDSLSYIHLLAISAYEEHGLLLCGSEGKQSSRNTELRRLSSSSKG